MKALKLGESTGILQCVSPVGAGHLRTTFSLTPDFEGPIFDSARRDRIEALVKCSSLLNNESKFLLYFVNAKLFFEEFAK
jgi:hypothetical protein